MAAGGHEPLRAGGQPGSPRQRASRRMGPWSSSRTSSRPVVSEGLGSKCPCQPRSRGAVLTPSAGSRLAGGEWPVSMLGRASLSGQGLPGLCHLLPPPWAWEPSKRGLSHSWGSHSPASQWWALTSPCRECGGLWAGSPLRWGRQPRPPSRQAEHSAAWSRPEAQGPRSRVAPHRGAHLDLRGAALRFQETLSLLQAGHSEPMWGFGVRLRLGLRQGPLFSSKMV